MEHLQDRHLNEPRDSWTPWEADQDMFYAIMTGQLVQPSDDYLTMPEAEPLYWFAIAA